LNLFVCNAYKYGQLLASEATEDTEHLAYFYEVGGRDV
jgi:hypothetical protein